MLDSGLSKKFTRVTQVSSFHTILDFNGDTEGIIVTHCRLDLLEVLDIEVPFAHVVGQKLFVVCLIFDLRGKWNLAFATVMEVRTCVLHNFDSLIAHLGLLCGGKSIR